MKHSTDALAEERRERRQLAAAHPGTNIGAQRGCAVFGQI